MKAFALEAALAALVLVLSVSAVLRAGGLPLLDAPVPVPPAAPRQPAGMTNAMLERAREDVIRRNPFRINRSPGAVRIGDNATGAVAPARQFSVVPARPALVIRAIVGGPPWSAVVDGLPNGTPVTVVREGDAFADLRIGTITRDTVVAIVRDSAWKYGVYRDRQ